MHKLLVTQVCRYILIQVCMYIQVCRYVYMYKYVCIYKYVRIYKYACIYKYVCIYKYICIYKYVCTSKYIQVFISKYVPRYICKYVIILHTYLHSIQRVGKLVLSRPFRQYIWCPPYLYVPIPLPFKVQFTLFLNGVNMRVVLQLYFSS
jgi:hypothetical protein